jgi:hypothetical protein
MWDVKVEEVMVETAQVPAADLRSSASGRPRGGDLPGDGEASDRESPGRFCWRFEATLAAGESNHFIGNESQVFGKCLLENRSAGK